MSEKLYYEKPYMRKFSAKVVCCEPCQDGYEVVLSETAFYPEGGGQPSDIGTVGAAVISCVAERNDHIIHTSNIPITPGDTVECEIDCMRRFDHMQQHTAEHVVSGIICKIYGADNVGFHIGEKYVTMDYNVNLTEEDIRKIEKLSNEAIYKNVEVKIAYYNHVPDISYRSKKALSGTIRIVTIDDYDVCACCGTQLGKTGEIGMIKITSFQKYKSGSRLFMVCGYRALADYNVKEDNIQSISAQLSSKPELTGQAVTQLLQERDTLKHSLTQTKHELIKLKAHLLKNSHKIYVFENDLSGDEMKKYHGLIMEKAVLGAVFSGDDKNGYKYILMWKEHNVSQLTKELNTKLCGKGGGKDIALGAVQATKAEIEEFMDNLVL